MSETRGLLLRLIWLRRLNQSLEWYEWDTKVTVEIPFNDNGMRSRFSRLQSLKWSWTIARSWYRYIAIDLNGWCLDGNSRWSGFIDLFLDPKWPIPVNFSPARPFWYFRWLLPVEPPLVERPFYFERPLWLIIYWRFFKLCQRNKC